MINLNISKEQFNTNILAHINDYSCSKEVHYGGAGSGKSYGICQKIIIKSCKQRRRVLVIRKTMASQRDSCWQLFNDLLSKWQLLKYCKVNKSDFTIKLPNESVFIFKGLDDPEKIKSIVGITDVWIEEASELNKEDYDQLNLRLRAPSEDLQMFISFNPISKANWVYKEFFENEQFNTKIYKSTYKDNRFLPQDYIDRLESLAKSNPSYYKIYALGEFCTLDKLIYTNWQVRDFENFSFDEAIFGLDFGYVNDPTAFVAAKVNKCTKEIYIYDELYQGQMLNKDIAQWLMHKGYSKEVIIADCAEQKSIEEIKRAGIVRIKACWKGKGSIMTGIDILQGYKIYVSSKCENMITELSNYTWKKDKGTGEYVNEPNDSFNHLCDALRYAVQKLSSIGLKTMSKTVLDL